MRGIWVENLCMLGAFSRLVLFIPILFILHFTVVLVRFVQNWKEEFPGRCPLGGIWHGKTGGIGTPLEKTSEAGRGRPRPATLELVRQGVRRRDGLVRRAV